ncbi:MAG: VanZ family protein [Caulobacterales bacterium]|nr:VanZ family protein [Caulobacterales bacterium]
MLFPSRWPRPVRLGLYVLAAATLLYLTNAPQADLPGVKADDKVEHATAWFLLTASGYVLSPRRGWAIPLFAALFGVLVEVLQGVLPFGRDAEVGDWIADCVGVAVAVLGYGAWRRTVRR